MIEMTDKQIADLVVNGSADDEILPIRRHQSDFALDFPADILYLTRPAFVQRVADAIQAAKANLLAANERLTTLLTDEKQACIQVIAERDHLSAQLEEFHDFALVIATGGFSNNRLTAEALLRKHGRLK